MRFDDSLDTVLAADMTSPAAVEWTWRQLVDLIGRGRAQARIEAIDRLRAIRPDVPLAARRAAAHGLQRANPPAALVALFIDDDPAVAAPVARTAQLAADEWVAMLPAMRPATRGVLRLRRDLPNGVHGALAAFGAIDFTLHSDATEQADRSEPVAAPEIELPPPPTAATPDPFVAIADIARELPWVGGSAQRGEGIPEDAAPPPKGDDFDISALVARIDARRRIAPPPLPVARSAADTMVFRFQTDAQGTIRWVDGVERGPLIGLSLAAGRDGGPVNVDGVASGALARRTRFDGARLEVPGRTAVAGAWRISGVPAFDPASGRFTGYRGTARRPRRDEAPELAPPAVATDALRQLVHELRTPTNAISGFAEMIEHEFLGPVPSAYREQATAIREQTQGLLDAIDDLDTAARLESHRLDLYEQAIELTPVLSRILADLDALATLRGAMLTLEVGQGATVRADRRALERLLSRFLTYVVSAAAEGQTVVGRVAREADSVAISLDRPAALVLPDAGLFASDDDAAPDGSGPLLGAAFGFRLARRLASELGGGVSVESTRLTLRLPAAVDVAQGQVVS